MAALAQSTRRKLSLLHLAQELQSVSKAGRIMGYRRDTFYEVRRAFQVGSVAALVRRGDAARRAAQSGHLLLARSRASARSTSRSSSMSSARSPLPRSTPRRCR